MSKRKQQLDYDPGLVQAVAEYMGISVEEVYDALEVYSTYLVLAAKRKGRKREQAAGDKQAGGQG